MVVPGCDGCIPIAAASGCEAVDIEECCLARPLGGGGGGFRMWRLGGLAGATYNSNYCTAYLLKIYRG